MSNTATKKNGPRKALLAKIHIARKDLGVPEDAYRALLFSVGGVESSKELTDTQLRQVLNRFQMMGWQPKKATAKKAFPGRPANMDDEDKGPMLGKIEAFLAEAGRPWEYADGIAQKMFGVQKVQWLKPPQLGKVIAALYADAKRHGRRTQ